MKQYFLRTLLLLFVSVISLSSCSKTATDAVQQQTDTLPPFKHLTVNIAKIPVQLFDSSYSFSKSGKKTNSRFYDSSLSYQNVSLLSNTKKITFRAHDTISFFYDSSYKYYTSSGDGSDNTKISITIVLDTINHIVKNLTFDENKSKYDSQHWASSPSQSSSSEIMFTINNIPYMVFTSQSFECEIPESLLSANLGEFDYNRQYSSSGAFGQNEHITKTINIGNTFTGSSIVIKLSL